MDLPKTLESLHHAYVCSADVGSLVDALEKRGVPRMACPDVYIYECQEFRIDNARELRERAYMNPLVLSRRIFIVSCAGIAVEAQNALLKTLEEPRGDAVFFFLLPSPERLLPTFRSRVQILAHDSVSESTISISEFLKASPDKRITMLEVFTKKKDGEERDFAGITAFLDALERALTSEHDGLHAVYRAKRYMHDKGALIKPLLEQVALLT
ncbi:hypothetical protein HY413_01380 [Candidatus Kaiserbacteria bacterium]|nr:hypothetical protein [Candidatus Kaiserbacteria bacterium]